MLWVFANFDNFFVNICLFLHNFLCFRENFCVLTKLWAFVTFIHSFIYQFIYSFALSSSHHPFFFFPSFSKYFFKKKFFASENSSIFSFLQNLQNKNIDRVIFLYSNPEKKPHCSKMSFFLLKTWKFIGGNDPLYFLPKENRVKNFIVATGAPKFGAPAPQN